MVVVAIHVIECCPSSVIGAAVQFDDDAVVGVPDVAPVRGERAPLALCNRQPVRPLDLSGVPHLQRAVRAGNHFAEEILKERPVRVP
jgi:hypothetical protein